jgi:hypothetical protein
VEILFLVSEFNFMGKRFCQFQLKNEETTSAHVVVRAYYLIGPQKITV